jgi:hypothetical protein
LSSWALNALQEGRNKYRLAMGLPPEDTQVTGTNVPILTLRTRISALPQMAHTLDALLCSQVESTLYLLYWYKSTKTDAAHPQMAHMLDALSPQGESGGGQAPAHLSHLRNTIEKNMSLQDSIQYTGVGKSHPQPDAAEQRKRLVAHAQHPQRMPQQRLPHLLHAKQQAAAVSSSFEIFDAAWDDDEVLYNM